MEALVNDTKATNGIATSGDRETVALTLRTLLAERFHRPLEEVTPDTDLAADLGVDSMDLIDVNISLEERFRLSMPEFATPEEVHVRTVRDLAALVSARLTAPSAVQKEPR
jgi:acyl carrier protein